MKVFPMIRLAFLTGIFLFYSCGNHEGISKGKTKTVDKVQQAEIDTPQLEADFLGVYHGEQPGYFMKNQYGDDMIIGGKKVYVPSCDYKFLLKENHEVGLQQTNLEDNNRVYYDGFYKIMNENAENLIIECAVSDGKLSNPVYVLTIKKGDKSGSCTGNNAPPLSLAHTW